MDAVVTGPAVGTSLEILAPYLPYGVEVAYFNQRAILAGVIANDDPSYPGGTAYVKWVGSKREGWNPKPVSDLLPILRPFAALCDPLPISGEVPAVEVAKIILDLNEQHCEDGYLAGITTRDLSPDYDMGVYLPGVDGASVILYSDWNIWADETMTPPAVYDYLRRHHFAVGLAPHQFLAK